MAEEATVDPRTLALREKLHSLNAIYPDEYVIVATAATMEELDEIPRVIIFKDAPPAETAKRLLNLLSTPTGDTENSWRLMDGYVKELRKFMKAEYEKRPNDYRPYRALGDLFSLTVNRKRCKIIFDRTRVRLGGATDMIGFMNMLFEEKIPQELQKVTEVLSKLNETAGAVCRQHPDGYAEEKVREATTEVFVKKRTVYFEGFSRKLRQEFAALALWEHEQNKYRLEGRADFKPVTQLKFSAFDTIGGGMLTECAEEGVQESVMCVILVGDGFGDASKMMAEAAYKEATESGKPLLVLVKPKRNADHPQYAEQFIKSVDPKYVQHYRTAKELVEKVAYYHSRLVDGRLDLNEIESRWQTARRKALQDFGIAERAPTDPSLKMLRGVTMTKTALAERKPEKLKT